MHFLVVSSQLSNKTARMGIEKKEIDMKKKSLVLLLVMAMIAAFCFSACGSSDSAEEFKTEGELLCVTEATFPPFDTTDDDGNIAGFDMDLISAIAEDQGFTVTFKDIGFDSLIPALKAKEADIITAGMNSLDEERQAKVDFCTPYYDSGLVVLVKDDNKDINSVDDLTADMKVASQISTTGADEANALVEDGKIAEAVILDKFSDVVLQVKNGDVAAAIIDLPVAKNYIAKQPGVVKMVGETMNAEAYAFAVQKGNSVLQEKINAGYQNVLDKGIVDELKAKWEMD